MSHRKISNRQIRLLIGTILVAGLYVEAQRALSNRLPTEEINAQEEGPLLTAPNMALAAVTPEPPLIGEPPESLEAQAARDPMGFFQAALDRYDRSVRDYTCTFTKQELVGQKLTKTQVMQAMFREEPFSVRLQWIKNQDKCSGVLYVADRWVEERQQMAVVVPGWVARLVVPYVMRPIHGDDAKKSSRRSIDQFGVRNSLSLILKYAREAQDQGGMEFKYVGNSEVDDRETLVFERKLPYTGPDSYWPDRLLIVHIDKQTMSPTLCEAFADDSKQELLGSYKTTDLRLNVNLPDDTFTKKGMGL